LLSRKSLAIICVALILVGVASAVLTLYPYNPLEADTTYTVSLSSNYVSFIATFWKDGNLETYCIVPYGQQGYVNLKQGFYNAKIYIEESGKFKEEFEIFVCRNITIGIFK